MNKKKPHSQQILQKQQTFALQVLYKKFVWKWKLLRYCKDAFKSSRDQNPPASKIHPIEIHPVKFNNRLPIEGKGKE